VPLTVIIACCNAAPYIRHAVESCLNQRPAPEKIVVVDDASVDGSEVILDEYARAGAIELIRNSECQGRARSVNRQFDRVTTKYVALLDADDVAMPGRFGAQFEFMETHPRVGCSSSFVRYINSVGVRIASGVLDLLAEKELERCLSSGEVFGLFAPAVILRADVLKNPSLRFRPEFWPADDVDLWNRIAEAGWQVLAQPQFLTAYRIHPTSAVTDNARNTRLQYEWVRGCLRARRKGRPEPTREEFQAELARAPWLARLNRWRKNEAKVAYRAAGFAFGEGLEWQTACALARAFCLQPLYVSRRLIRQISKP
jgi:glycosyltransferase involved in cell wall biosynthesis